jgi:hypothetical protein
MLDLPLA